ncbi:unnamed protein product [Macrosiphum euphorbiae]|uniref:Uncharacterized protein n=1 Tax=Macrosiphum euphorbiae TaxID=13131 RepID=A0AAV0W2X9_9HEMI|nr:unnamed protein product [Macrosiphum euphorbiae]
MNTSHHTQSRSMEKSAKKIMPKNKSEQLYYALLSPTTLSAFRPLTLTYFGTFSEPLPNSISTSTLSHFHPRGPSKFWWQAFQISNLKTK